MLRAGPGRLAAIVLALAAAAPATAGCDARPDAEEIAAWREEARAANRARAEARKREQLAGWRVEVSGDIEPGPDGRPVAAFDWDAIEALATTRVTARCPLNPPYPEGALGFRGVRIAALLERAGVRPRTGELTLLAFDAYRRTIRLEDALHFPILLSLECDGKPIPRNMGGPTFTVYPTVDHPELAERYDGPFWVYYVTHLIVGTDPPRLRIGARTLGGDDLARLPQVSREQHVGFRIGWPGAPVLLHGVRLRDALAAAGAPLGERDSVWVRGKAPSDRDRASPHRIDGLHALRHDILLVTHTGLTREPIPASLGGPILVAFPTNVPDLAQAYKPHDWVSFVEELEVMPP